MVFLVGLGSSSIRFSQNSEQERPKPKITPEELGWLGGYGHRNRPAEGVAADLWTRALALEDKLGHRRVLVSADIHIFTRSRIARSWRQCVNGMGSKNAT